MEAVGIIALLIAFAAYAVICIIGKKLERQIIEYNELRAAIEKSEKRSIALEGMRQVLNGEISYAPDSPVIIRYFEEFADEMTAEEKQAFKSYCILNEHYKAAKLLS